MGTSVGVRSGIELWPGGRASGAREIGRIAAANVSDLNAVSEYLAVLYDDTGHHSTVHLTGHRRDAGFWPLLARLADSHRGSADRIALGPQWQELADRIGEHMYADSPSPD